jgi:hypothetical protein
MTSDPPVVLESAASRSTVRARVLARVCGVRASSSGGITA